MEQFAITRTVTVAAGRFAPGHLGELTQLVPFEMVDDVLAETGAVQRAGAGSAGPGGGVSAAGRCLFAELGYSAGLAAADRRAWTVWTLPRPTAGALAQARRRLGAGPLRALFDLLRGPAATTRRAGALAGAAGLRDRRHHHERAGQPGEPGRFAKQRGGQCGGGRLSALRLLALVACGTRTIIDAVFGPAASPGEISYAHRLVASHAPRHARCWPTATSPPATCSPRSPAPARRS